MFMLILPLKFELENFNCFMFFLFCFRAQAKEAQELYDSATVLQNGPV